MIYKERILSIQTICCAEGSGLIIFYHRWYESSIGNVREEALADV